MINLNGQITDSQQGYNNRAFKYGDALFETIRIYKGESVFVEDHISRLREGMMVLKMKDSNMMTTEWLNKQIALLKDSNHIKEGGRARLCVFRNSEGLFTPASDDVAYILEVNQLDDDIFILNEKGLVIDIYHEIYKPVNMLSSLKTNNCLIYVMAGIHKRDNQLDECLLVNDQGCLVESSSSNLFLIKNGELFTPPLSAGCIPGVMRHNLIKLCSSSGIACVEKDLHQEDMLNADELFLTNAITGIRWVEKLDAKEFTNTMSKQLVETLNQLVSA